VERLHIRHAEPADYAAIVASVDAWWGGRRMADMLPRLFLVHFRETTFVAEREGEIVAFVAGFLSQTFRNEAYIHFAGVHPAFRGRGLGRLLYERFFAAVRAYGRNLVRCVTSPQNRDSIAFHLRLGFSVRPGDRQIEGIPVAPDHDGTGEHRVLLTKTI